jgi:hypothetical protein
MNTISRDPSALYNSRYNAPWLLTRTVFYDAWATSGHGVSMAYGRLRSEISQSLATSQSPAERATLRAVQVASYPMEATSDAALAYSSFEGTGLGSAGRFLYTAPRLGVVFRPTIKLVTYGLTADKALDVGSQIVSGDTSNLTVNDFVDLGFGVYGSYHLAGGRNGFLDPRNYNWLSPNGASVDGQVAFGANRWLPVSYTGRAGVGRAFGLEFLPGGGVRFRGRTVDVIEDLSHLDEATLRRIWETGRAPYNSQQMQINLHHVGQDPRGNLWEIGRPFNDVNNRALHPLGNAPGVGLTDAQLNEFANWRYAYWSARAGAELMSRGVTPWK